MENSQFLVQFEHLLRSFQQSEASPVKKRLLYKRISENPLYQVEARQISGLSSQDALELESLLKKLHTLVDKKRVKGHL